MRAVIYTGGTLIGREIEEELRTALWEVTVYEKRDVFPKQITEESIDLLVIVGGSRQGLTYSDGAVGSGHDYEEICRYLTEEMLFRYELIQKYVPALKKGMGRRIGFVSCRYASISDNTDTEVYALHMDAAGMSMQAKMVQDAYGSAEKDGFTVRYFAAELDTEKRKRGISAAQYMRINFCQDRRYDPRHYEENHLRMRDQNFVQIPW